MEELKKNGLSFVEMDMLSECESNTIAKELIENLFFNMAKLSTKYDNKVFCDLPYTYSERRLDSVLLPALSKLCDSKVLVEIPAIRQCSNRIFKVDELSGRIDYWCIYKNYSFVIELKQSFDCFTTSKTREKKVTDLWFEVNKQLQSIKKEIVKYEEATNGVVRIGLHIITSYSDEEPNNQLIKQFNDGIENTANRFIKDLGQKHSSLKPDLLICWKIPRRIVMDEEHTFPGLWAITKIYPAVKHKGAIE